MRKDLLVSMLAVAAATPAGVYANVPLDNELAWANWSISGLIDGQDLSKTNLINGTIKSLSPAFGTLKVSVKDLHAGTYNLGFGTVDNANVTVSADGASIKPITVKDGKEVVGKAVSSFTVSAAGESKFELTGDAVITIEVVSKDNINGFEFGKIDFDIIFAEDVLQAALQEVFDTIQLTQIASADNKSADAEALRKQYTALNTRVTKMEADINSLSNVTLEIYNKLGLYNKTATITTDLNTLKEDVKTYNAAVEAENNLYANNETFKTLDSALTDLEADYLDRENKIQDKIAALIAEKDDATANALKAALAASKAEIDAAIKEYKDALAADKDKFGKKDAKGVCPKYEGSETADLFTAAKTLVETLDIDKVDADIIAYKAVQANIAALKTEYDKLAAQLMGISGVYGSTAMENLTKTYTEADKALAAQLLFGAAANAPTNQGTYDNAIAAMQKIVSDAQANQAIFAPTKEVNLAAYAELEARWNGIKAAIEGYESYYTEDITKIEGLLAELNAEIENAITQGNAGLFPGSAVKNADDKYEFVPKTDGTYNKTVAAMDALQGVDQFMENNTILFGTEPGHEGLQTQLEAAKKAIEAIDAQIKALSGFGDITPMVSKFEVAYNGVQKAIDDVKTKYNKDPKTATVIPDDDKKAIEDGISAYKTQGVQAAADVLASCKKYDAVNAQFGPLNTWFNDNKGYAVANIDKTAFNVDTWAANIKAESDALAKFLGDIKAILGDANLSGQAAADQCLALTLDYTADATAALRIKLVEDFTAADMAGFNKQIDDWKAELADVDAAKAKYGEPGYNMLAGAKSADGKKSVLDEYADWATALEKKITEAKKVTGDASAVVGSYDKQELPDAIYNKFQEMKAGYGAKVQQALDNVAALATFNTTYDLVMNGSTNPAVDPLFDDIAAQLAAIGTEPAIAYYLNLLNNSGNPADPKVDSYLKKVQKTKTDAEASYNKVELHTNGAPLSTLNNLRTEIAQLPADAQDNYDAYLNLVAVAQSTNNQIITAETVIENKASDFANLQLTTPVTVTIGIGDDAKEMVCKTGADIMKAITDLKNDVTTANAIVYDAYGRGACKTVDAENYKKINATVETLLGATDNILAQVIASNNAAVAEYWTPNVTALDAAYKAAVDEYVTLSTETNTPNADYVAWISVQLKKHESVYKNAQLIINVKEAVDEIVENAKKAATPVVLTEASFAAQVAEANSIKADLEGFITIVDNDAQRLAQDYYDEKYQAADQALSQVKTAMLGAGVSTSAVTEVLKPYTASLAQAVVLVDGKPAQGDKPAVPGFGATAPELSENMGTVMASIDGSKISEEKAAQLCWSEEYEKANAAYENLKSTLENVPAGYVSTLTTEQLNQIAETLTDLKEQADNLTNKNELNATTLKDLMTALNAASADILTALGDANLAIKAAQDNQTAKEGFVPTVEDLKKAYDNMCAAVGSLDLTLDQFNALGVNAVAVTVDGLLDKFVNNGGNVTDAASYDSANKVVINPKYTTEVNNAYAAILACYAAAYDAEKANMDGLYTDTKLEFNVWRTTNTDDAAVQAMLYKIEAANTALGKIAKPTQTDFAKAVEAYGKTYAAFKDVESKFLDVINEMNPGAADKYDKTPQQAVDEAVAELQAAYDAALADYNNVADILTNSDIVDLPDSNYDSYKDKRTKLDKQLAGYLTQLDALKADWEGAGNLVVLQSDAFKAKLAALETQIDSFTTTVNNLQATYHRNKVNYDRLNAELTHYNELMTQVKALIAGYQAIPAATLETYKSYYECFENAFELSQTTILNWYNNLACFDSETLPEEDHLKDILRDLTVGSSCSEVTNEYKNVVTAVNSAETAIAGYHTDQADLNAELEAVKTLKENVTLEKVNVLSERTKLSGWPNAYYEKDENGDVKLDEDGNPILPEYALTLEGAYKHYIGSVENYIQLATDAIAAANALTADANDKAVEKGDVTNDNQVNIADLNALLKLVLDLNLEFNGSDYSHVAGDLNKDDVLTMGDYKLLLNLFMGIDVAPRMASNVTGSANTVALQRVSEDMGVTRYAVLVNNVDKLVNAQFDIVLPEGMTLITHEKGERSLSLDMLTNSDGNGRHRFVLASTDIDAAFTGVDGAIAYIEVAGEGEVSITNVLSAADSGIEYNLGGMGPGTTGIENTLVDSIKNGAKRIYNAAGQMLRSMQRGVNIVRNADGSTTKVYNNK